MSEAPADTTLKRPCVEIVQRLEQVAEAPLPAGSVIAVIARTGRGQTSADPPTVTVFSSEATFRQYVQQLLLGDANSVEQCRAMAQSFRRMEAVMERRWVRTSDTIPNEQQFHRALRRAERNGELCCGDAEERWFAWYRQQQQQHEAWQPPPCFWGVLHTMEAEILLIENLLSASTPLDTVIKDLQWLAHLTLDRALELIVHERHEATSQAHFFPSVC